MRLAAAVPVALAALAAGCGGDDGEPLETAPAAAGFRFAESAVAEGEPVDARYTCDGENVSPALSWEGVPEGTAELVLVLEDPDAPGGTFTHWLVYGLDPGETSLPEGVPAGEDVSSPALRQGVNDFGQAGYGGPCPPAGETHRYAFRLFAVDGELGFHGGVGREELLSALEGRVLAEATLTPTYARP